MRIDLNHVVPAFLEAEKVARSAIWNHQINAQPGERIHIIAPSGSGKTSIMHFLYGMRQDYQGVIRIDGKDSRTLPAEDIADLRSKKLSIIFQDLRLFAGHTVFENIEIKRVLNPFHPKSQIREMAARLGIVNKLDKPVSTCSYGEQQRVAIIRALQQPFEFLLMDEPFSHLDDSNKKIAYDLIEEEVAKREAGMLIADLQEILFLKSARLINL